MKIRLGGGVVISLAALLAAVACGDDEDPSVTPATVDASFDAARLDAGTDGTSTSDTGVAEASAIDAAADATAPKDAAVESSSDAGPDAALEASTDASADAPSTDAADAADAGPAPALFATHDGMLVRFNLATAAQAIVGSISPEPYRLAFNGTTMFGLVVEAGPSYRLVTVDPCTGVVTSGPTLSIAGGTVTLPEGLAFSGNGSPLYVALSQNGVDNASEALASVNVTTGALTVLGSSAGDIDLMTPYQGSLLAVDATLSGTWSSAFSSINTTTSAPTTVWPAAGNAQLTGIAVHPTTSTVYAWQLAGSNPFNLVTVNVTTGALTPIGVTHSGSSVGGFTFAAVTCP